MRLAKAISRSSSFASLATERRAARGARAVGQRNSRADKETLLDVPWEKNKCLKEKEKRKKERRKKEGKERRRKKRRRRMEERIRRRRRREKSTILATRDV